jgi:hypothetical protein
MFFADKLMLDKPRRTADGYMAIRAKAARTGVYQYLGSEVDPEGKHFAADQVVNVYRPADEVFDAASLGSFVGKPITDDHPSEAVNAGNWRDLARGTIMGATRQTIEDGEYVNFDLAFLDAALISKIEDGKRELSNGYAARLDIEDGTAPDGTPYQAVQREIRGNHVAVVDAGRAGSVCRIGDAAKCSAIPSDAVRAMLIDQRTYDAAKTGVKNGSDIPTGEPRMKKIITIDGLQIDVADADTAAATITTLQQKATDAATALATAQNDLATVTTDKAKLEAEVATLKQQLADAKPSPAALMAAARSYADTLGKAKALGVTVADDASEADARRAVVDSKLGAAANGWNDDQIAASFVALTADVKASATPVNDALASAIGNVRPMQDGKVVLDGMRRAKLARQAGAYLTNGAEA